MRSTSTLLGLVVLAACSADRPLVPAPPNGTASIVQDDEPLPFVGRLMPLRTPTGATEASGVAVNDDGFVVGTVALNGCTRIILWDPSGSPTDLGRCGQPSDINNANRVVGTLAGSNQAFIWSPSTGFVELGTLGGTWSRANAISEHGWVVGASELAGGVQTAFLYDPVSGMRDLSVLMQRPTIEAVSVNVHGEMLVDWAPDGGVVWTLVWSPTTGMRKLPKFHGWTPPPRGRAINDGGWVTGEARVHWLGDTHAALWIPGQAPISLGMLPPRTTGYSMGTSLSLNGRVVGVSQNATYPGPQSFVWTSRMGIRELQDGSCYVSDVARKGHLATGSCAAGAVKWLF